MQALGIIVGVQLIVIGGLVWKLWRAMERIDAALDLDVDDDEETYTPAQWAALLSESMAAMSGMHALTLGTIERIVVPASEPIVERDPAGPIPQPNLDDLLWDPTDNEPWLVDPEYQHVAPPRTAPGDAPDLITHPLGIPGLEFTSPLTLNARRVIPQPAVPDLEYTNPWQYVDQPYPTETS